jgi:hypothetical protein
MYIIAYISVSISRHNRVIRYQEMLFTIIWRHTSNWSNVIARMYIIAYISVSISRCVRVIMHQLE